MKIAIVGHGACPLRGSEPGLSWNWAWHLSLHHEVWLVTFPEYREEIEAYSASHPNSRLHIVWSETNAAIDPWKPGDVSTGYRFKIHYFLWLARAKQTVRKLIDQVGLDLVHHVGLNTVSAPSQLWRLPVPFVWGPVGGGQFAPPAFKSYYGSNWRAEKMRRLRIQMVARSAALRRTVRGAAFLFATNKETHALLVSAGADKARLRLFADNGLSSAAISATARAPASRDGLTILWAGRLETRKALPILIDALSLLEQQHVNGSLPPLHLFVAGDGPKRSEWEVHAKVQGVGHRITFLGLVAPTRMQELFEQADLLAFTSLQDSFGSVVLEALGRGLPAILLDHQGAAFIPDEAAIKIPLTTPNETVQAFAREIVRLTRHPEEIDRMSHNALAAAHSFAWDRRAAEMTCIYERIKHDTVVIA